jgi:polyisoprenoid-binding protein YceI
VREELGWVPIAARDRAELQRIVEGERMLFSAKHPSITFEAERCEPRGTGMVSVRGELAIRGMAKSIEVLFHLSTDRGRIEAAAVFDVRHGDFGMQPYREGPVQMAEEITIIARIVARSPDRRGPAS